MDRRKYLGLGRLCLLVVGIHLLTIVTDSSFYLAQLTMAAYYGLAIIGLAVLMGYAGQISLGHAGFVAIGGYLSAALCTRDLHHLQGSLPVEWLERLQHYNILRLGEDIFGAPLLTFSPWAACLVAICLAMLIAFLIGIPVLRLKGHYLAMATLGFGTIVYRILLASPYFGEADGISDVPPFPLLPSIAGQDPVLISGDFGNPALNYYLAWAILLLGMLLLLNLIDSRVGRALRALNSSEEAAQASGVNTARYKLQVFVVSAAYAALAGVLLTHYNGSIGPAEAGTMKSVRYMALVAVGGMTNLWSTLLMGVGLTFLSLRGVFGTFDDVVFAAILLFVMLFTPGGLFALPGQPWFQAIVRKVRP